MIGTLNEGPLHAALKQWYAQPGDREEVPVGRRFIDLMRGELLIEIQTGSFSSIRGKLEQLVGSHTVRLVHPIPRDKWIVRVEDDPPRVLGRRRSPLRGELSDAFEQLVSLAKLLAHPNLSVELLLTQEEEVRRHEPGRARRRKGWTIVERRLVSVLERHVFDDARDLVRLLPAELPEPFNTADLARTMRVPRGLAQKIAYCLRLTGAVEVVGKQGNAHVYEFTY